MTKVLWLIPAAAVLILFGGHVGSRGTDDHTAAETYNQYQTQMNPLLTQLRNLNTQYESTIHAAGANPDNVYRNLTGILPEYVGVVAAMESIGVGDEDLMNIHQLAIDAAQDNVQAVTVAVASLEQGDSTLLGEANRYKDEAVAGADEYSDALAQFIERWQ